MLLEAIAGAMMAVGVTVVLYPLARLTAWAYLKNEK